MSVPHRLSPRLQQILEMLREDPGDAFLRYALALEKAKEGQLQEAIVLVQELLHDQPEYLGAYYQLGQWLEQTQQPERAKEIYTAGVALARDKKQMKASIELQQALDLLED
jgi:tetratricopeptide (TPR) repeat protein